MLEAFVITLREGVEAALIIGVILAYLKKTGQASFDRYVYWGLLSALLFSIAGGMLFQKLDIDPENELLEGTLMFTAAIFIASVVIWMWRTGRHIQKSLQKRVDFIVSRDHDMLRGWGLAGLTFFMIAREGIETILFFAALSLSNRGDIVYRASGGLLGILLAVLFALFFVRGSLRIDLRKFFAVTSIILGVLALKLFVGGIHEWGEVRVIHLTPSWMKLTGLVTHGTFTIVISMMLLAIPTVMVLLNRRNQRHL